MKSEHQLNEQLKQLSILDLIESEKTKQIDYELQVQRNITLKVQLGVEESRIDLQTSALSMRKKKAQNEITEQEILGMQDNANYLASSRQIRLQIQSESLKQQALEASEKAALNAQKLKELRACFGGSKLLGGNF